MTVQLLNETLAVLSCGRLCEEHGDIYEWASGQRPHLTKNGERILCKTENVVPVVVLHIVSAGIIEHRVQHDYGETEAILRKSKNKNQKKSTNQATRSRLRDIAEWLEEFTDNLEVTVVQAPANTSHDSESPAKVATRKQSIYTHFPKDRNCNLQENQDYEGSLPGSALTKQFFGQKIGDLITADRMVLNEEGESRNNHRYAVVVQDLATQWIQSYPCKTKSSQETERSSRKFLGPSVKPNVIYIDNSLEFGKSCAD